MASSSVSRIRGLSICLSRLVAVNGHCRPRVNISDPRSFWSTSTRRQASTQVKTKLQQQQQSGSPETNDTVNLSEACVTQLKRVTSSNKPYLRVSVDGGGCSGFQYKFELDSEVKPDDRIFEKDGGKIIVDETSLEYLKGSTVDYQHELIRSAFRVSSNPKAEHGCSCGASFSVKLD